MPRAGPRKVQRYSLEFKLKAVKLSQLKGVEVQAVADALEIHPFMLSRWRKEARDGVLRGRVSVPKGMQGRVAGVYRPKAGTHRWFSRQPNHVRRTHATRPNQIWVGDVTYLGVGGRWWYLIVVLDQCSRRVLAWRLAATRDSRVT